MVSMATSLASAFRSVDCTFVGQAFASVLDALFDEIAEEGVLAIEWAEKMRTTPRDVVRVTIDHVSDRERRITVESNRDPQA